MVKEHGHLVDYDEVYTGYTADSTLPKKKITGYRVYSSDGSFIGLLDLDKAGLWYVDESSLSKKETSIAK